MTFDLRQGVPLGEVFVPRSYVFHMHRLAPGSTVVVVSAHSKTSDVQP